MLSFLIFSFLNHFNFLFLYIVTFFISCYFVFLFIFIILVNFSFSCLLSYVSFLVANKINLYSSYFYISILMHSFCHSSFLSIYFPLSLPNSSLSNHFLIICLFLSLFSKHRYSQTTFRLHLSQESKISSNVTAELYFLAPWSIVQASCWGLSSDRHSLIYVYPHETSELSLSWPLFYYEVFIMKNHYNMSELKSPFGVSLSEWAVSKQWFQALDYVLFYKSYCKLTTPTVFFLYSLKSFCCWTVFMTLKKCLLKIKQKCSQKLI